VVLVGMMGSGKSTVGRILAGLLDRPLLDSDLQVQARTGRTVREIFETDGEATFRRLESEALADAVAGPPAVIAAAGGSVLDPANRVLLAGAGTVVWLRADPDVLVPRATRGSHRPLLATDASGTLRRLDAERAALYAEVADHVVDVSRATPAEIARTIVELLP
jgi:shikimate kinase